MKKREERGLQKVDFIALSLLSLGVIGVFIIPFLVTQKNWGFNFGDLPANEIGDTIGGITAPFVGLISAGLVYLALREQVKANKLISNQIAATQIEKVESVIVNGLISEIDEILESYEKFRILENDNLEWHTGKDAANMAYLNIFHNYPIIIEGSTMLFYENLYKIGFITSKFNLSKITQRHLIKEFDVALIRVLPFTFIQSFEELNDELFKKKNLENIRMKYGYLQAELSAFYQRITELDLH